MYCLDSVTKVIPIYQAINCTGVRISNEGNGNPLQYSCLENSMDRGAWWATVHGVTKSQTQLSDTHTHKGHKELDMTEVT